MSNINWPENPIIGDTYISPQSNIVWEWNGYAWGVKSQGLPGPRGPLTGLSSYWEKGSSLSPNIYV